MKNSFLNQVMLAIHCEFFYHQKTEYVKIISIGKKKVFQKYIRCFDCKFGKE